MNQNALAALTRTALTALVLLSGMPHAFAAQKVNNDAAAPEKAVPAQRPSAIPHPRGDGSTMYPMRRMQAIDRQNAALRLMQRQKANEEAGLPSPRKTMKKPQSSLGGSGMRGAAAAVAGMMTGQVGTADLYAFPNYAVSKLPTAHCRNADGSVDMTQVCRQDADCLGYLPPFLVGPNVYPGGATCTGPVVAGTGIRKFVDDLPVLCALGQVNNLGKCLPIAAPDTTTFPGADYYELGVKEFYTQFHSDLPNLAKQRGFRQINSTNPQLTTNAFLGPIILAQSYRPARMTFTNELPTGAAGDLNLPTDTTLGGTGLGPDGTPYTQNRIAIHLHGGNTPWISDGTQHQWTVPAGEATNLKKGLAVGYVPDMWYDAAGNIIASCAGQMTCAVAGASRNPGDGKLSFYWPNEQSGRMEFYHDHAYGIPRLNVMAGVAAGYLVVNPPDEDALSAAGVPGTIGTLFFDPTAQPVPGAPVPTQADLTHMIPLVIQDRTFVPPADQLAFYDPTWDTAKWGGEDSVWLSHVYTPNQWSDAPDGSASNAFGRWDYGPLFWPPQQSLTSLDGEARPLFVACQSAAAITPANLTGDTQCPTTPNPSLTPESFLDTPIINGVAYPKITVDPVRYRFQILNAANDRYFNLSFYVAYTDPQAPGFVDTEVKMVEAIPSYLPNYKSYSGFDRTPDLCDPNNAVLSQVTGLPVGPDLPGVDCYPNRFPVDARQGGVPRPLDSGPRWVQIGTESGILPAAAVIAPMPTVYEQNKRNVVVLNVLDHSLFMGPAERADAVVDFSQYAGKTLILYSDAPAPVPAGDPRQDYYTWGPDMTTTGGAPTPLPGYGPNIRTIMQVVVRATPAGTGGITAPLNDAAVATISAALRDRFAVSQLRPIVPESVYSNMYQPLTTYADTYLPINVQTLTFTPVGTSTPVDMPLQWKALHELFSTDYGRMNSVLAVEIPATNWLVQTTIPYSNMDPATEFIDDDKPAIWKVTHNGVDTHTIHFHLMNVQIVNRVGWDGAVRPPDDNELGWKESVRMNPLEDIYVALQPAKQRLPWPQPDMIRPLDVDRPLGTVTQFTGVDIYNNPINVSNQLFNFGQEYVWHCHLLGHEENDMLRAEVFVVSPEAPTGLSANLVMQAGVAKAALGWTDASMSAQWFTIQRDTDPAFGAPAVFRAAAPATQPGPVTFTDLGPLDLARTYYYRVRADKELNSPAIPGANYPAWSAWSATAQIAPQPIAQLTPASSAFGNQNVGTTSTARAMTLANIGTGTMTVTLPIGFTGVNAADFIITSSTCGATLAAAASCTINVAFKPLTAGAKVADLTVVTNSVTNPTQNVALTGTGRAPQASANPTSLVFTGQNVNSTSAPRTVTLSNLGAVQLVISSITVTGDFARGNGANNCGNTLNAGSSCNLYVTFRPTVGGNRVGSLAIASNDPVNPTLSVALSGWGNVPPARGVTLAASPTSPQLAGTPVLFTAQGSGSTAPYSYQFSVTVPGVGTSIVCAYSTTNTCAWTLPIVLGQVRYTVIVDVRTNPGVAREATTSMFYTANAIPPATGATLTANPASPQARGTTVTFTAAGSGSVAGYSYQFWLFNGTTWTMVRDWSATTTWAWTIPANANIGQNQVQVWVRTSPLVQFDVKQTVNFTVQ
jgi:FtsP/CotA-like multicopper oxidase with cupredoxin domain